MDGGAYCTLTPVVLSRGAIHAGGPVPLPERPDPGPGDADEHAAERRVPRVRRAADGVRGRDPDRPARRGARDQPARDPPPEPLPRRRHDADRPGPARERRGVGGARAGRRGGRVRGRPCADDAPRAARRAGSGIVPTSALRTGRDRTASGIGLALAWHGAGFTGSGEVKLGVGRLDRAGRRRADPDPDRLDRDGAGDEDDLPAARRRGARRAVRGRRDRAAGHRDRARLGPDGRQPDGDGRRRAADQGRPTAARRGRGAQRGRAFAAVYRDDAASHGPTRIDQQFEPYPGVHFDDATYRGDAYPAFGWAACVASVDVDLDSGEVTVRDVVAADDIGRVIHPVLAEGQVEGGTLQAIGYATIEEIKLRDGRYLNDRLATYIIPTALDAPRITSILVEAPFAARRTARRASASCRWTSGRRRSWRRSTTRPASGSTTCRRARSGSSPALGATPPTEAPGGLPASDADADATGDGCRRRGADRGGHGPPAGRPDGPAAAARPAARWRRARDRRTSRGDSRSLQRQRRAGRGRRARACGACSTSCARTSA